jgi:hypothetical protein
LHDFRRSTNTSSNERTFTHHCHQFLIVKFITISTTGNSCQIFKHAAFVVNSALHSSVSHSKSSFISLNCYSAALSVISYYVILHHYLSLTIAFRLKKKDNNKTDLTEMHQETYVVGPPPLHVHCTFISKEILSTKILRYIRVPCDG